MDDKMFAVGADIEIDNFSAQLSRDRGMLDCYMD